MKHRKYLTNRIFMRVDELKIEDNKISNGILGYIQFKQAQLTICLSLDFGSNILFLRVDRHKASWIPSTSLFNGRDHFSEVYLRISICSQVIVSCNEMVGFRPGKAWQNPS